MKLLIHPGMPKAASTTIQSTLMQASTSLEGVKVFETARFGTNASRPLGGWIATSQSKKSFAREKLTLREIEQIWLEIEAFRLDSSPIRVISGEGIWNWSPSDFARFTSFFPAVNVEARVVIRDPWTVASSRFQQHLKTHKHDLTMETIQYQKPLAKFASIPTKVLDFGVLIKSPVPGKSSIAGTLLPELKLEADAPSKNSGLSWPGAFFLYRLNRELRQRGADFNLLKSERGRIIKHLRGLDGQRFQLHPSEVPVDMREVEFVKSRFGIHFTSPCLSEESTQRLRDFNLPLAKEHAEVLESSFQELLSDTRLAKVKQDLARVLRNVRKKT
jgi:hypothetical protein